MPTLLVHRVDSHLFVGVKIVILHQHFKVPARGGAIRSWYLASAAVEAGHTVTVLSGHNGDYKIEIVDGIEVHWLPVAYDNRFDFKDRSKSFLRYVWQVIRRPALYRGAELCYAISVPLTTGLAAIWLRRWHRIPFIFEVGDLWPDAPIELGFIRNRRLRSLLYALEKMIYGKALAIVALSEPIRAAVEIKTPNKFIEVIPNMADTDFYFPSTGDPAISKEPGLEGKFVVAYIGALGYANGLDYILQCAAFCKSQIPEIAFVICGDGAESERLQASARKADLHNLKFLPLQNREGVKKILAVTEAVFVSYRPVAILETGSPNKYFDGLAAGKLIIVNFSGWIREEIEQCSCGIHVDPDHPGTFAQRISPYVNDKTLLRTYQNNARILAERKYSRSELSRRFVTLLENC